MRDFTYVSPVKVMVLELSNIRDTSPVFSPLIVPLNEEPFVRFMVKEEMESTTMLPVADWLMRFSVTVPPLLPELPHESFWMRRKLPVVSLFMIVLFSRLIVAVVLVT